MHITTLSFISIALCISCSLLIVIDLIYRPQKMQIMNIVWPVTALYSGLLGLLLYYYIGRQNGKDIPKGEMDHKGGMENTNMKNSSPLWQSVLKGALHCGSGCTLGDLISARYATLRPRNYNAQ